MLIFIESEAEFLISTVLKKNINSFVKPSPKHEEKRPFYRATSGLPCFKCCKKIVVWKEIVTKYQGEF